MSNGHRQIVLPTWLTGTITFLLVGSIGGGVLMWRDSYANDDRHDEQIEENEEDIERHEERLDQMEKIQIQTDNHLNNLDASVGRIVTAVEAIAKKK